MLRQSQGILYRICLAFTDRHPENVADLYQEIVCNLWHGWPKFRHDCHPKTWVYRVALNTAGMELRKRKRKDAPVFAPLDERLCESLSEEADDTQLEYLYSLIDQLPDDEKKLIYLQLERFSCSEIATIVGKSESAVKQKLYRIKQKMIEQHKKSKGHE